MKHKIMLSTMYFLTRTCSRKNEFHHVKRLKLERWLFWEACLSARMLYCTRVFSHTCLFTRVSFRTLSVSNSSLLWTKALGCKTISTMSHFVLLITYAHNREIGDTLSVPCHHMRTCAFIFFPAFPWRVTYFTFLQYISTTIYFTFL